MRIRRDLCATGLWRTRIRYEDDLQLCAELVARSRPQITLQIQGCSGIDRTRRDRGVQWPVADTNTHKAERAPYPHSRPEAISAPSARACSFDQTIESATIGGALPTNVPNPQSTPAMTRSRPTMSA